MATAKLRRPSRGVLEIIGMLMDGHRDNIDHVIAVYEMFPELRSWLIAYLQNKDKKEKFLSGKTMRLLILHNHHVPEREEKGDLCHKIATKAIVQKKDFDVIAASIPTVWELREKASRALLKHMRATEFREEETVKHEWLLAIIQWCTVFRDDAIDMLIAQGKSMPALARAIMWTNPDQSRNIACSLLGYAREKLAEAEPMRERGAFVAAWALFWLEGVTDTESLIEPFLEYGKDACALIREAKRFPELILA